MPPRAGYGLRLGLGLGVLHIGGDVGCGLDVAGAVKQVGTCEHQSNQRGGKPVCQLHPRDTSLAKSGLLLRKLLGCSWARCSAPICSGRP